MGAKVAKCPIRLLTTQCKDKPIFYFSQTSWSLFVDCWCQFIHQQSSQMYLSVLNVFKCQSPWHQVASTLPLVIDLMSICNWSSGVIRVENHPVRVRMTSGSHVETVLTYTIHIWANKPHNSSLIVVVFKPNEIWIWVKKVCWSWNSY